MHRVLIAGCGDVGSALGLRLADAGVTVFGLRRSTAKLPPAIRPVAADLAEPASLRDLPRGIDTLFYTAAADGRGEAAYQRAYVDGLANVLRACDGDDALRRLLFTSSTSVYGVTDGSTVDERTATEPLGFAGRILLQAERLVRDARVSAIAVRFGGIYGPGRNRLIRLAREGEPCVAEPPLYTNRIHRDDCAGVLAHLAAIDSPAPVYVAVDDAPAPQCEVMDWLADQLGVARPRRVEPGAPQKARGNKRCVNTALKATGFEFRYPTYREGYAAVLRAQGLEGGNA